MGVYLSDINPNFNIFYQVYIYMTTEGKTLDDHINTVILAKHYIG